MSTKFWLLTNKQAKWSQQPRPGSGHQERVLCTEQWRRHIPRAVNARSSSSTTLAHRTSRRRRDRDRPLKAILFPNSAPTTTRAERVTSLLAPGTVLTILLPSLVCKANSVGIPLQVSLVPADGVIVVLPGLPGTRKGGIGPMHCSRPGWRRCGCLWRGRYLY